MMMNMGACQKGDMKNMNNTVNRVRAHIRIMTSAEVNVFVNRLNLASSDKFVIENSTGNFRADAKSVLGVIYMMTDFNDEMYLVNVTNDGNFPAAIDDFRVMC